MEALTWHIVNEFRLLALDGCSFSRMLMAWQGSSSCCAEMHPSILSLTNALPPSWLFSYLVTHVSGAEAG